MRYIRHVQTDTSMAIAFINGRLAYMLERDGKLQLGVGQGDTFGIRVENHTGSLRAYPTFVGDGTSWMNIYLQSAHIIDPNSVQADGGMWEVRPQGNKLIEAFALPGNRKQNFVADASGVGFEERRFNQLRIYERSSTIEYHTKVSGGTATSQPGGALGSLLASSGSGSRDKSAPTPGPAIGAGEITYSEREKTGFQYKPDAREILTVQLVDRDTAGSAYNWWLNAVPAHELEIINR